MTFEKLKNIAKISAGFPLRGTTEGLEPGDVHFIQLRNISLESGIDWLAVSKVSLPTSRVPKWLINGDIIFAARGSNNYAIALNAPPQKTVCAPHFFVITPLSSAQILPEFLAWQINQKQAQSHFARAASGAVNLHIRRDTLETLPVALPPLAKQQQIIDIDKTYTKERRITQQLLENRQQQIEAIAQNLFNEPTRSHS